MENLYELRNALMRHKLNGFIEFYVDKQGKWFKIDDLIDEIDNLRVCQCPPKVK